MAPRATPTVPSVLLPGRDIYSTTPVRAARASSLTGFAGPLPNCETMPSHSTARFCHRPNPPPMTLPARADAIRTLLVAPGKYDLICGRITSSAVPFEALYGSGPPMNRSPDTRIPTRNCRNNDGGARLICLPPGFKHM